jgi:hypothetical protein
MSKLNLRFRSLSEKKSEANQNLKTNKGEKKFHNLAEIKKDPGRKKSFLIEKTKRRLHLHFLLIFKEISGAMSFFQRVIWSTCHLVKSSFGQ